MGNWLKDKYKELLLNGLITLTIMLLLSWKIGLFESKQKQKDVISKKADIVYVDKQDAELKHSIEKTETLFLNEIRELRIDLRLKQDKQYFNQGK